MTGTEQKPRSKVELPSSIELDGQTHTLANLAFNDLGLIQMAFKQKIADAEQAKLSLRAVNAEIRRRGS